MLVTPPTIDLSNCDREQIQFASAILDHGALLTVTEPDLTVQQASVNTREMLGVPVEELLGGPLSRLLEEPQLQVLREHLRKNELAASPGFLLRAALGGADFDLFGHRRDGVLVLEFERRSEPTATGNQLSHELHDALTRLEATPNLPAFLDLAVTQIRELTGFDRVMAYKFLEDGSGEVMAESLLEGEGLTPYLGLHYPPSDIPAPARRLFSLTWLRHQPDISYTPVPITPVANPLTSAPLDMSYALLRSVSVMYSQYLKNMGTQASMVMTLMKDGRLWGLVACHHHRGPKHVPSEVRVAAELMVHMLSVLMSAKEHLGSYQYRMKLKAMESGLVANLLRENDFSAGLLHRTPTVLDFVESTGAALVVNGRLELVGRTPTEEQVRPLVHWLSGHMAEEVFATDSLAGYRPEAAAYSELASGLLAMRFTKSKDDYLLWFRAEQLQSVNWAGDPGKPVDISDDQQRLMPRTSFAIWKEMVRMKSKPWLDEEKAAAEDLRLAILELVLRKADELGALYQNLERSHAQLDAFAYVASHDLKEPLRGIANYAVMLTEDYGPRLDEEGRRRLATLSRLSQRMDDLLNSLLEYSRVGRVNFADADVDLNQVVAEALDTLRVRMEAQGTEVRVLGTLPRVRGDRSHLGEVMVNLISNAIKYNDKEKKWVEIGADSLSVYVRDNGIGISPEHSEQIFQIFRRLHGRDEFGGGAGAGLTITKKIIERHGGRIWLESTPGVATTFRFTLATRGAG
ncbi:MAG: GAF domain-containing protein [Bryobacteraceae bacterium]|nr:GAF domain-containing protein [Bryobacteraceae bacterium]